jgi:N-formylglutamate deformylase
VPQVIEPSGPRSPIIAHVPHASTVIPVDVRREITLTDEALVDEVLRLTDWYSDELFAGLGSLGATAFVNDLSRFVFDPERFVDLADEPTEARGQGLLYWRGTRGQELRVFDADLRERRIKALYEPYHAALDGLVSELLAEFGACLVVDCHSFPSVPMPSELDQAPDRPDICIGTDPVHTPAAMAAALEAAFAAEGLRVKRDSPFAGTFVPSGYFGTDARVTSVMIEVRRDLYMDEASGERLATFEEIGATITNCVWTVVGRGS